jgi:hypothetical protein
MMSRASMANRRGAAIACLHVSARTNATAAGKNAMTPITVNATSAALLTRPPRLVTAATTPIARPHMTAVLESEPAMEVIDPIATAATRPWAAVPTADWSTVPRVLAVNPADAAPAGAVVAQRVCGERSRQPRNEVATWRWWSFPQAPVLVAHLAGVVARLAVDLVSEVADIALSVAFLASLQRSVTLGAVAHGNVLPSVFDQRLIGVRSGLHDPRRGIDGSQYVIQPTLRTGARRLLDTLRISPG